MHAMKGCVSVVLCLNISSQDRQGEDRTSGTSLSHESGKSFDLYGSLDVRVTLVTSNRTLWQALGGVNGSEAKVYRGRCG